RSNDADWSVPPQSSEPSAGLPPGAGFDLPFQGTPGPSPWIIYHRDGCWGEMNGTPIMSELYFTSGVSVPMGGRNLGQLLDPGLVIGGGARALFFNAPQTSAWTLDASIININNHARPDREFPLSIFVPT